MNARLVAALVLLALAERAEAQSKMYVTGGEVTRNIGDRTRLASRIPGVEPERRARVLVQGDSAQRLAMNDFEWRGRVSSLEIDEEDARVFWDVKIVPDSNQKMIVRYRVDASTGGILDIKEFHGIRAFQKPPSPKKP
ncbi:MAG TPA: hypothetical protein VFT29_17615 [Gemmatimonadaceae bacterium]|nr:hypothetical protein [Gemmatimonadaceae bacterium]